MIRLAAFVAALAALSYIAWAAQATSAAFYAAAERISAR
jgi:hypothetical protein